MSIIKVRDLGVRFRKKKGSGEPEKLVRGSLTGLFKRMARTEEFWALKGLNFTVEEGDVLGVIGNNGAGKSTLLRVIVGVLYPDEGQIEVKGRVSSLLSLGAGFMLDLSGRDNIYLNGVYLGLTKRELDELIEDIISFAELENFINSPIRYYSSGMKARLGFSIAAHVHPDILVIDEILSAGDKDFRVKAEKKMKEMLSKARAIVIVSHNMAFISEFCNRAIWLENGRIKAIGPAKAVTDGYMTS